MSIGSTIPECTGRNYSVFMRYPDVITIAERLTLYALTKHIAFSFIAPLPFCLKENRIIRNITTCSAGHYAAVIDSDGTFRLCSACNSQRIHPQAMGSLPLIYGQLNEALEKYLKKYVPSECLKCSKLVECKAACPLYWKIPGIDTPSQWKTYKDVENMTTCMNLHHIKNI